LKTAGEKKTSKRQKKEKKGPAVKNPVRAGEGVREGCQKKKGPQGHGAQGETDSATKGKRGGKKEIHQGDIPIHEQKVRGKEGLTTSSQT